MSSAGKGKCGKCNWEGRGGVREQRERRKENGLIRYREGWEREKTDEQYNREQNGKWTTGWKRSDQSKLMQENRENSNITITWSIEQIRT